jgi:hypothetical protein
MLFTKFYKNLLATFLPKSLGMQTQSLDPNDMSRNFWRMRQKATFKSVEVQIQDDVSTPI